MKIVFLTLFCLLLVGLTSYSFAEWVKVDKNPEYPKIMLQFVIRNSDGALISYVETTQILGYNKSTLNNFLDTLNNTSKEFFIKDGQKYESQQWQTAGDLFNAKLAYSGSRMVNIDQNEFVSLVDLRHDSHQTEPGDISTKFWTVIRPVS